MTSPARASDSGSGRLYDCHDLGNLPSVTTIINALSKPALVPWAAKMVAERAIKQENEWHAIQQEDGDEKARLWLARAHKDASGRAATIGSAVHWLCENEDRLDDPEVNDKHHWFLDQLDGDRQKNHENILAHLEQYRLWLADGGFTVVARELTVAGNGYAGTLDMICERDGKHYVGDIKTGGVYDSAALQMSAYRHADWVVGDESNTPMPYNIVGGFVLQLKPRSHSVTWMDTGVETFDAFEALRRIHAWTQGKHQGDHFGGAL